MLIENEEALTLSEAAKYLGVTATALNNVLRRRSDIKKYRSADDEDQRYIKKTDLDKIRETTAN